MTKLYYTDPLKAAWMAREFAVEYCNPINHKLRYGGNKSWKKLRIMSLDIDSQICHEGQASFRYHIHPDSLSIFEPKEGDLVYYHPTDVYEIWRNEKFEPAAVHKSFADLGDIVTRKGKAFFMPQSCDNSN